MLSAVKTQDREIAAGPQVQLHRDAVDDDGDLVATGQHYVGRAEARNERILLRALVSSPTWITPAPSPGTPHRARSAWNPASRSASQ
jgi:hypothetical protein